MSKKYQASMMNTTLNAACCFNLRSQDVCSISKLSEYWIDQSSLIEH